MLSAQSPSSASACAERAMELVKQINHVLALMRLDLANYNLDTIRPLLLQMNADYESQKFAKVASLTALAKTRAWLKREIMPQDKDAVKMALLNMIIPGAHNSRTTSHLDQFSPDQLAETLELDRTRLQALWSDAIFIITINSIFTVFFALAPQLRNDERFDTLKARVCTIAESAFNATRPQSGVFDASFADAAAAELHNFYVTSTISKTVEPPIAPDMIVFLINRLLTNSCLVKQQDAEHPIPLHYTHLVFCNMASKLQKLVLDLLPAYNAYLARGGASPVTDIFLPVPMSTARTMPSQSSIKPASAAKCPIHSLGNLHSAPRSS